MKTLITLFFLLFFILGSKESQAQIFQNKNDILKELGTPDDRGVSDDGLNYIVYEEDFNTKASGEYTRHKVIYFVEMEDGKQICNMWKILEPSSETNSTVSFLKDKYVEVDYMQWKDYETEILYDVEVEDEVCIVTAVYDDTK